jgi:hypothetical protein
VLLAVPLVWDTAAMATPIAQAPPPIRAAAERHAPDRAGERSEAGALLERYRAGELGIVLTAEQLGNEMGLDQDPPRAAPAV